MRAMVELFQEHLRSQKVEQKILGRLEEQLQSSGYDMEHLIENLDNLQKGIEAQLSWGISADDSFLPAIRAIRQEAEWFVMHVCERVLADAARCLWSPTLQYSVDHSLVIATTNYDRAIEIAAAHDDVAVNDGFEEFGGREHAVWRGFDYKQGIKLIKLHGSTDWYHTVDSAEVWKLRHPMPLYGGLALTTVRPGGENVRFHGAAILPSREKKVTLAPYPRLSFEFQKAARDADVAVFLGASLRDPDMRDVCASCRDRIPTYVVLRNYVSNPFIPNGVSVIQEPASRFLFSTFPTFLSTGKKEHLDQAASVSENRTASILDDVVVAKTPSRSSNDRCLAIERLSISGVSVMGRDVESFLADQIPEIRLFALGLINNSPHRDQLLERAERIGAESGDEQFISELQLLRKMLGEASFSSELLKAAE